MLTVIFPVLWIAFDVCICVRTAFMTKPMSWTEIAIWGSVGLILGLTALAAGWHEREAAHAKEITYERDRSDLLGEIRQSSGYNQGSFDRVTRKLDEIAAASSPQVKEEVKTVKSELEIELAERKAYEWPRLTPEQKQRLTVLLQRTSEHDMGQSHISITRNDLPDIVHFVDDDLVEVFRAAGWKLPRVAWGMISPGMHVRAPLRHPNADLLATAFSEIIGKEAVEREIIAPQLPAFFNRGFVVGLAIGRRPLVRK
jgi:hypothetical protein